MVPLTGGVAAVNVSVSALLWSLLSSRDSSTVDVDSMEKHRTCDRDWYVQANVIPPLRPVETQRILI